MTEPVRASDRARAVLADNPGPMTLDGTNTWVLREPGATESVVVDPGPLLDEHLDAIIEAAGPVGLIVSTHRHADHTEAVERFAALTGAPARAVDPDHTVGADPLVDEESIDVGGLRLTVVATPGHTSDSVCLLLPEDGSLLTGDTVLGRGTTIIAHPDGSLGPYLESLELLRRIVDRHDVKRLLPGHGPVVEDPAAVLDYYLAHRHDRLEQVRGALAEGAVSARDVVEKVYADVDESLWPAAEVSVQAQLDYLRSA